MYMEITVKCLNGAIHTWYAWYEDMIHTVCVLEDEYPDADITWKEVKFNGY